MSLLISDRDGVLFDTCRANIDSYLIAAKSFGISTDHSVLATAVHAGQGFDNFHLKVWGILPANLLSQIRVEKSSIFMSRIDLVRLNSEYLQNVLLKKNSPYLVTRASLASTQFLLDIFSIDIFEERVISVDLSESKFQIFSRIAQQSDYLHSDITIIDDSTEVILESSLAGFKVVQYPHFCSF